MNKEIKNKKYQLIELRTTWTNIEKSITFRILVKLNKKIEKSFPNKTRRGELKKIVAKSASTITEDGFSQYCSADKNKIKRKEFRILEPIHLSEYDEKSLLDAVKNSQKKRLKIKSHDTQEIKNDEIIIEEDETT